jgi:hypothetical protein
VLKKADVLAILQQALELLSEDDFDDLEKN